MNNSNRITINQAIEQLLCIVKKLRSSYLDGNKKFTLDGRLLGDIGEILVSEAYKVTLFDGLEKHHDGKTPDGRLVQIKATMKETLTFPADHIPDFYLGIKIKEDGTFIEIFNGPGDLVHGAIAKRSQPKNNLHSISLVKLAKISKMVEPERRIQRRHG